MLNFQKMLAFSLLLCLVISCKENEKTSTSDVTPVASENVGAKDGVQVVKDGVIITTGGTMGTYYNVRYVSDEAVVSAETLDSILLAVNMQLSTYIPESTIAKLNSSSELVFKFNKADYPHFIKNYRKAYHFGALTQGKLDPTIAPLVNFWGFGYDKESFAKKDTSKIKEILKLVGFAKWQHHMEDDSTFVFRRPAGATLDFSSLAKGHGVDVVSEYFESKGVSNYFVDIGGEVRAAGTKTDTDPWLIGINVPDENAKATDVLVYMPVKDFAVATSGNYRNFYVEDGQKFSHIISPRNGFPWRTNVLSATVVSKDCIDADAVATALMVTVAEKAKKVLEYRKEVEGFLVYLNEAGEMETWQSSNFPVELIEK